MDIDFIDEDGWQAVQLRAENGNKAQDCTTLNDRSNVRSIVDSLCRQLATTRVRPGCDETRSWFKSNHHHHNLIEQRGLIYVAHNAPFFCAAMRARWCALVA